MSSRVKQAQAFWEDRTHESIVILQTLFMQSVAVQLVGIHLRQTIDGLDEQT